jgi:hypothetical protein
VRIKVRYVIGAEGASFEQVPQAVAANIQE